MVSIFVLSITIHSLALTLYSNLSIYRSHEHWGQTLTLGVTYRQTHSILLCLEIHAQHHPTSPLDSMQKFIIKIWILLLLDGVTLILIIRGASYQLLWQFLWWNCSVKIYTRDAKRQCGRDAPIWVIQWSTTMIKTIIHNRSLRWKLGIN